MGCDYRQTITAPPIKIHNSQIATAPAQTFPACCVFAGRSLVTASNTEISSASCAQVLSSQSPVQNTSDSLSKSKSESDLLYDGRFTAIQFVLASSPLRLTTRDFFFQVNPCGHSPYVTFSLTKWWVCLLCMCLAFRQVYISHIQHVTENSFFCTIYSSSVSRGFAEQIMSILRILCYNGSLATWTIVHSESESQWLYDKNGKGYDIIHIS
jgi:hypothetical protein